MRVSSATFPFLSGTLKSTRTSTRFPCGSRSRIVRLVKARVAEVTSGRDGGGETLRDVCRDVGDAAGVAPLVVVPRDDLDHVAEDDRVERGEDARSRVAPQIARDQRFLGVAEDRLERPGGGFLEDAVHLVLGDFA